MQHYTKQNLVARAGNAAASQVLVEVTPALAGWDFIHFQARQLQAGQSWAFETGNNELALVVLGGTLSVESTRGQWAAIGGRANVFDGPPHALYLPRHTTFAVTAASDCEFAAAWVATDQDHEPRLVTPDQSPVEIRGGDHATRQINGIVPPGFDCHRLVVVEVYTPGGNWSSYPPHKHDIHRVDEQGQVVEADLEEVYFYKFDHPSGFAFQRIYTDETSPLQQAGAPIDAVVLARNNDAVIIPEGYHPVSSPVGYTTYYLNVLAGSAQSLANYEDPQHAWVKDTYAGRDPRVPIY